MNKRTRVLNALKGKEVDKVPVSFWYHFTVKEAQGRECVNAHIRYYLETDIDFIKIMSDGFFGYPLEHEIKKASDWNRVKPQGKNSKYIQEQLERVKLINEELKGSCCTFYNVFAPFSIIRFASSDEMVMKHLKEDKKAVISAMNAIAEDNGLLAELVIREGGCDGIYMPLQGGELDRFTFDEYRELITPTDLAVLERANEISGYNIAHLCAWAGYKNRLELWKDYPATAFNWSVFIEEMSLAEGRDFFGGKTVIGGFDNRETGILFSGTETEIKNYTKNLLDEFGTGQGLIIGADCTLSSKINIKNIGYVVEAVEEYFK